VPSGFPNPERTYRGLYAGISEIASIGGWHRQYVSHDLRRSLPVPKGFLLPNERRPFWFLRDVLPALHATGRVLTIPPTSPDVEDWEYKYDGPIIGVSQFAQLARISSGNVHFITDPWPELRHADVLRMGTLWREEEALQALKAHNYPRKRA
jgi:hypothetical protein